jgi:hypothetical protein
MGLFFAKITVCWQEFCHFYFHLRPFPEKRARVFSGRQQWPAGTCAHQQLRTGKQRIQPMAFFANPRYTVLAKPE